MTGAEAGVTEHPHDADDADDADAPADADGTPEGPPAGEAEPDGVPTDTGDDGEAPADERVFPTSRPRIALQAVSAAVIAWGWALIQYQWWGSSPDLAYGARVGDGEQILMMVKTISERGWFLNQPRLGFPFGQTFYDFPMGGETWQLGIMKGITTFVKNPAAAVNLYYFFGYGVVAVVTFLVLRHLRFRYGIALVASLAFTFLDYHFVRGEWHLWRSSYFSVPLAALVILWSQQWRAWFLVDPEVRGRATFAWSNLRTKRVVAAVVICVVIGGTETMCTVFTIVYLAIAAIVAAIRWKEPARLVAAGLLAAVIAGTFLVCSYPSINYWRVYGQNKSAANRGVSESESYGMKIWTLVTPPADHRISALGKIGQPAIKDARVNTEQGANLDLLATAGFFGALYGGLASGMLRRKGAIDIRGPSDRDAIRETGSIVVLVSILFGVIGGLSVLVSRAGFQEVRVWDRMAIFIALFALFIVASWAERLDRWLRGRSRSDAIRIGLVVLMVVFALGDTIQLHNDYPAYRKAWANDDNFVHAIERKVPAGTAIFQLPILAFPESVPPGTMQDYDPLRGYLHDNGKLEWSYGIIKGRPQADWQTYLRDYLGPIGAMPAILGMGFTGLWFDTHGYTDGGVQLRQIERLLKVTPLRSADGRFLFFDLRPYKKRLGLSDAALRAEAQRVLHIAPPVHPS